MVPCTTAGYFYLWYCDEAGAWSRWLTLRFCPAHAHGMVWIEPLDDLPVWFVAMVQACWEGEM